MPRRQTTGSGLTRGPLIVGLVDHGLFSDRLPACFTSRDLLANTPPSTIAIRTETNTKQITKLLDKAKHDYIRYYQIRNLNVPRQMAIPHPESHVAQSLAIERVWTKIKSHCARPKTPVSRLYVRKQQGDRIFQMNYKGPERWQIEEEDLSFMAGAQHIVHADISTCFPSMYTHSIPWAMHGRNAAKKSRSISMVGNLLDKATQLTRDGQTNGLLVGPHTSNIISEIILTDVDKDLLENGYTRVRRHIDDYTYYANTYSEAENFVRHLGISLRKYELMLNAKKTEIRSLPQPIDVDWRRDLNALSYPMKTKSIRFGPVRALLDVALKYAQTSDNSAILNYAIKMVLNRLTSRGKRLFTRHVLNLMIAYPYLAPLAGEHVFDKHYFSGIKDYISEFTEQLLHVGIQNVYPEAIGYALYYALKYDVSLMNISSQSKLVIEIDDCLSRVLLLEYAKRHRLRRLQSAIRRRADRLKGAEKRDQDRFWLLIYQLWSPNTLKGNGQIFLSHLKSSRFQFVAFP